MKESLNTQSAHYLQVWHLTSNSRTISGIPDAVGTTTVTYTATNSEDSTQNISITFTIEINEAFVTNLKAQIGYGIVKLLWAEPSDVSGVAGYEYKVVGKAWETIVGSDASTVTHTITGLSPSSEYQIAVRVIDTNGDNVGESLSIPVIPNKITGKSIRCYAEQAGEVRIVNGYFSEREYAVCWGNK